MSARQIPDDALAVLSAGNCAGSHFFLPKTQLDRKLYEAVNKVLDALGGKWNRSAKAHIFGEACEPLIESAIETGSYTKPSDMGWFPTPPALAARIVDMANVEPGHVVLEPSGGTGSIARLLLDITPEVYAVEIDNDRYRTLDLIPGLRVFHGDFMDYRPAIGFDRVVMNPPFAKRADIHHVLHAYSLLNPGGRLVSIMSGGVWFREDKLNLMFREKCATVEQLPAGSFTVSGTEVSTVVVTMEKPA